MRKLFAAGIAFLTLAVVGTAVTAEYLFTPNSPALAEASRWEERTAITEDIIDGRLPLLKAATTFSDLNRQSPLVAEAVLQAYPGDTEMERTCQQVLAYVRDELNRRSKDSAGQPSGASSTDSASVVLKRLQAELEAAKGKDGRLHRPEDVG